MASPISDHHKQAGRGGLLDVRRREPVGVVAACEVALAVAVLSIRWDRVGRSASGQGSPIRRSIT